jgi:hypothetical protein
LIKKAGRLSRIKYLNIREGVISMANRDIKKEVKKKKKAETGALPSLKPIMPEPELVKKPKKN